MSKRMRFVGIALLTAAVAGCDRSPSPPAVAVAAAPATDAQPAGPRTAKPAPADGPAPEPAPVPDGGSFSFPDDSGGKALAKTLAPTTPPAPPVGPASPRERTARNFAASPAPPPAAPTGPPPRLVLGATNGVRPAPLPDRVPPDLGGPFPELPPRADLPTGPGVRVEGRDSSKAAELPLLSNKPVPDRAPLSDPTAEFTARSVISPVLPLRAEPAGFVRINLPDPFEHAAAAKPRTPWAEDPNRSLGSPPPPK
jgi:hypothetical protein